MTGDLAVVTGASTGLGYQFARLAHEDGHPLLICADEEEIHVAADKLRSLGAEVEAMVVDLSTRDGVMAFWDRFAHRDVGVFVANAGRALGHAFHEQEWSDIKRLIDLNVLQTTSMVHKVGRKMHDRGEGRILVTGSIGGFVPGPFDAVYDATKAYLDSFCYALQDEWADSAVTLTCLMPGPLETPIFTREGNDLADTPIAQREKQDPVPVAEQGWQAMREGKRGSVPGAMSKAVTMLSGFVPDEILAKVHRMGAEPD